MNIADQIQNLRKSRGITQEELADRIGVSRQAVSKWESGQSMPDIEKVILLSDYFKTTTDYLLKGLEPAIESGKKWNAVLFSLTGTILNGIGLTASIMVWTERQMAYTVGMGLIIMMLGTGIFLAGQFLDAEDKERAKLLFLLPNIWILSFIPLSCCFNILTGLTGGFAGLIAPIPMPANSLWTFVFYWIGYIFFCVLVNVLLVRRWKVKNKKA